MREGFEQTGNIWQSSTGYLQVASGTTAQRPTANNGMLRYNLDFGKIEHYVSNAWANSANDIFSISSSNSIGNSDLIYFGNTTTNTSYSANVSTLSSLLGTASSPVVHPGFYKATPSYYGPVTDDGAATLSQQNFNTGTVYFQPIYVGAGMTFDRVGFYVSSSSGGGNIRMALYSNNYPLGQPGSLILDCGNLNVSGGSGAAAKEYTITAISPSIPTIYWLAIQVSATLGLYALQFNNGAANPWLGRNTISSAATGIQCFSLSTAYAPFSTISVSGAAPSTNSAPFVWLRNV